MTTPRALFLFTTVGCIACAPAPPDDSDAGEVPDAVSPDAGNADGTDAGDASDAGEGVDAGTPTVNLVITLAGLADASGQVCHAIFRSNAGWPDNDANALSVACATTATLGGVLRIDGLDPALTEVAVSLFHDENSNGELDERSLFGIPVPDEPYGFSNDPNVTFGAPTYDQCKRAVQPGDNTFTITFKSL